MCSYENVTVVKRANVYFDGKCVSHTIHLPDGSRKSVGVILPSVLRFETTSPEKMEGVGGVCRVRLPGEQDWKVYGEGEIFSVPGNAAFEIACDAPYHYVCHFV